MNIHPKRRRHSGCRAAGTCALLLIFLLGCTPQTAAPPPLDTRLPATITRTAKPASTRTPASKATPAKSIRTIVAEITKTRAAPTPTELEIDPIFNELGFFLGGGPGDIAPCGTNALPLDYGEPRTDPEVIDVLRVRACGWATNESVNLTITGPDEKTYQTRGIANESYDTWPNTWEVTFQPPPGALPGSYLFTWTGASGTLKARLTFKPSTLPRIYLDSGDPFKPQEVGAGEGDRLVFRNFAPSERVTLKMKGGNLHTRVTFWYPDQIFNMDQTGGLRTTIQTPSSPPAGSDDIVYYTAQGEISGSVKQFILEKTNDDLAANVDCPNALPSRIAAVGFDQFMAQVARVNGAALRIHAHPGFSTPVVARAAEGEMLGVTKPGKCVDGVMWWYIETMTPYYTGWVAESQGQTYLLEPPPPG